MAPEDRRRYGTVRDESQLRQIWVNGMCNAWNEAQLKYAITHFAIHSLFIFTIYFPFTFFVSSPSSSISLFYLSLVRLFAFPRSLYMCVYVSLALFVVYFWYFCFHPKNCISAFGFCGSRAMSTTTTTTYFIIVRVLYVFHIEVL